MDQKRPDNTAELESKMEKLSLYKEMLHSLKKTNVIDDYLLTKQGFYDSKYQTEGVFKKMEEYHYNAEQRTQQLTAQLQSVTETVNGLKKDIDFIKEKMDRIQVHDLMEKMNRFMDHQNVNKKTEESSEVDRLTQEIQQLKQQIQTVQHPKEVPTGDMPPKQNEKVRTSEYRKLQNMLKSSRISPQRNDYHQPVAHQPSYTPYQQNYPTHSSGFQSQSPSYPKQTKAKVGKSKTYVNPQFDLNQQTTVRANSKKNDEKTAQINIKNNQELTNRNIQFQLMKPESAQLDIQHAEMQKKRIPKNKSTNIQPDAKVENKKPQPDNSDNEPSKNKERSLFSIFQRWNS
ncbi:hypothetical protein ACJA3J_09280 [Halobacillus sp. SY10]|uniref:hypothetical protein n=1 Tax=Halobacillus sp. SY10 TaxID=3381356 RepID=UPI0038794533